MAIDRTTAKSGRWGRYRQASPPPARHRPGARSARRERCSSIVSRTTIAKEIPMWFHTLFDSMKHRRSDTPARRTPRRPTASRLRLEALEDRWLPSFLAPVSYLAGSYPVATVAADFNNDTVLDLAVAN